MQQKNQKSTQSVRLWRTLITAATLSFFLVGCSVLRPSVDTIETVSKPTEKTPLAVPAPEPLELSSPNWVIVTPTNADEVYEQLESAGRDPVLIALLPSDYERLSIDFAEIRRYINNQRAILIQYQEYYEGTDSR